MEEFDHIVIGGGASGCAAAAGLVRDGGRRVLLLEAGWSNRHPLLDLAPGVYKLTDGSRYMTYHRTEAQDHLHGRVQDIPQANVLGGGSSVNAQVYMRGRPADYDEWDNYAGGPASGTRWRWQDVLPHFRAMEGNNRFSNDLHGAHGPLLVSDPPHIDKTARWFLQSMQELGLPFNPDFNGTAQYGTGFYQFTNRAGKRCSAAHAFVEPLRDDTRLTVRLGATVERIEFSGRKAIGVTYVDRSGTRHAAGSSSDVILAAGALQTPKILMLSGLGPAAQLRRHGIGVLADLPGVGANLADHPEVPIIGLFDGPHGYFRQGEGWRMLKNGLQYLLFGSGPINSTGFEAGAFFNPDGEEELPSIQAYCVPIVYLDRDLQRSFSKTYGVTISTVLLKPRSRGFVTLRSENPHDLPRVSPQLLQDEADIHDMAKGIRFLRRVLQTGPLGAHVSRILAPSDEDLSDAALAEHCRRFVKTNYHPSGTARIGSANDDDAVLDSELRCRGVDGLRVCDMSAAPTIVAGNTSAPAMMLGSRCASLILRDQATTAMCLVDAGVRHCHVNPLTPSSPAATVAP
ncbi:GMC family oxidoreductase [Oricola indica]|uniref:GMC family oxidoreductase n=1 Tax=Oricola indica TaxID=2872591 RepID=UPI001CBBDC79